MKGKERKHYTKKLAHLAYGVLEIDKPFNEAHAQI